MIKYFCDRCGKEIIATEELALGSEIIVGFMICSDCNHRWAEVKSRVVACNFINMSDEELQPYRCDFKAGDQVITSTGETGIITKICTCDRCKERGFFEPEVEVKLGTSSIHITENDRQNGFRSFYRIGDHVFGNIDEDTLNMDISMSSEAIRKAKSELETYTWQLAVLQSLKGENNNEL